MNLLKFILSVLFLFMVATGCSEKTDKSPRVKDAKELKSKKTEELKFEAEVTYISGEKTRIYSYPDDNEFQDLCKVYNSNNKKIAEYDVKYSDEMIRFYDNGTLAFEGEKQEGFLPDDPPDNPDDSKPEMVGPRRDGESFGDCFVRNWKNFCTDFASCAAQITNPKMVAAAIIITCTMDFGIAPQPGRHVIKSIETKDNYYDFES